MSPAVTALQFDVKVYTNMDAFNATTEKQEEARPTDKKCEESTNERYDEFGKPEHDGDNTDEWATKFETLDDDFRKQMSRKLLFKIDTHLLPFLIIMYLLN